MAKKLFSFEEFDEEVGGAEGDLEVTPESGEAADVLAEITEDNAEITEIAESAEEGIDAADELEDVAGDLQESLGDTVEVDEETGEETVVEGDGEGISAEASRQYQKRIASIMKRVGANPKAIYSIYAKENFESASSRRANTRIALEGVADALKDLWERIKAAIKAMWKKIKDFWNKHLSTVGRLDKAVKAMKKKVNKLKETDKKGIVSGKRSVPSSLLAAFPIVENSVAEKSGVFTIAHMQSYTIKLEDQGKVLTTALKDANQLMEKEVTDIIKNYAAGKQNNKNKNAAGVAITTSMNTNTTSFKTAFDKLNKTKEFGTKDQPLVGGVYYEIEITEDDDFTVEVTIERETVEKTDKEITMEVVGKQQLQKLLEAAEKLVKAAKDDKKALDSSNSSYENFEVAMNKAIVASASINPASAAANSKLARTASVVNSKLGGFSTRIIENKVRAVKGYLDYCSVWVKATNKIQ